MSFTSVGGGLAAGKDTAVAVGSQADLKYLTRQKNPA
jgi:hypothetical protein